MSMKENVSCSGFDYYNLNLIGDVGKTLQAVGGWYWRE